MADFTQHEGHGSSSSTPSLPSHGTNGGSVAGSMAMSFVVSTATPLFSTAWRPASLAQYVGTCVFLIALSVVFRFLLAWKSVLELRWARRARRQVLIATAATASSSSSSWSASLPPRAKSANETPADMERLQQQKESEEGEEGEDRGKSGWAGRPWRFSTELPRAAMTVVVSGVGYLLFVVPPQSPRWRADNRRVAGEKRMLAVMTMNVGYFMSVLAGVFVGELACGRFIGSEDH